MNRWIHSYHEWLQEGFDLRFSETEMVLTAPFLDPFNDYVQIYGDRISDEEWRITDDGYTVYNLKSGGVDVSTEKRRDLLERTTNRLGVEFEEPEICATTSEAEFPRTLHRLIQAILAVGDLMYTARPYVESIFLKQIEEWFSEEGITRVRNTSFDGESGLTHRFDFVIPGSPADSVPERILDALSSPSKKNIEHVMFSWQDVRPQRGDANMYAILNDSDIEPPKDKIRALRSYDVTPLRWSRRTEYLEELAA